MKGKCFRTSCKFLHPSTSLSQSLDSYIPNYSIVPIPIPIQSDSGRSLDSYIPHEIRKSSSHRSTDIFIEYCKDFLKGQCKAGQDCKYAHVLNAASPHVLPASSRMSLVRCADFNRSFCHRDVCKFAHIENWDACLSASNRKQLREKDSNSNSYSSVVKEEKFESSEHEDKKRKYDDYHFDSLMESTHSGNSYTTPPPSKKQHSNAIRTLFTLVQDWDEDRLYRVVTAIENEEIYDFGTGRSLV
jgi:hypothetical protein